MRMHSLIILNRTVFDYSELIISSSEGDFVYHPIEEYQFSRDLNPDITWDKVYSQKVQYQGLYTVNQNLTLNYSFMFILQRYKQGLGK